MLDESGAEQYRLTRNKLMSIKGKALLRKHCNSMKQLTQLLQLAQYRKEQLQAQNETLIYEIIVEKFSLDPQQFASRITMSKICFIRLPDSDLVKASESQEPSRQPTMEEQIQ